MLRAEGQVRHATSSLVFPPNPHPPRAGPRGRDTTRPGHHVHRGRGHHERVSTNPDDTEQRPLTDTDRSAAKLLSPDKFILKSAKEINLELTDKALRRGSFNSVPDLISSIEQYMAAHNDHPKPFVWTATAASILDKVPTRPRPSTPMPSGRISCGVAAGVAADQPAVERGLVELSERKVLVVEQPSSSSATVIQVRRQ